MFSFSQNIVLLSRHKSYIEKYKKMPPTYYHNVGTSIYFWKAFMRLQISYLLVFKIFVLLMVVQSYFILFACLWCRIILRTFHLQLTVTPQFVCYVLDLLLWLLHLGLKPAWILFAVKRYRHVREARRRWSASVAAGQAWLEYFRDVSLTGACAVGDSC